MRGTLWLSALLLGTALATPVTYTVAPLDHVNIVTAENETDIENFTAVTNKITGNVTFDPAARTGSAELKVDGSTLKTGVALRDTHMNSADWFNFAAQPQITFKTTRVTSMGGDNYRVTGDLTLHGVTKSVTTTARVKLTPANDVTKASGIAGDALAVSLKLNVNLSGFGVTHMAIKAGRVQNTLPVTIKFIASTK